MNAVETTLRETPVPKAERPNLSRKKFDPTRIFRGPGPARVVLVYRGRIDPCGAAVDRFFLVQTFKQRERVVILDPSGRSTSRRC